MINDRFRRPEQKKKCAYCNEDIVRKKQNNLQWSVQQTHGYCKNAYMREQTLQRKAEEAKKPRRFFTRSV